jgi:uncharacterized protein YjiS (DUF1127 family)
MSITNQTFNSSVFFDQPAAAAPSSLLSRAAIALLTWQHRASERRQLARLSSRDLKDVGLTRGDIASEIDKPFWRA